MQKQKMCKKQAKAAKCLETKADPPSPTSHTEDDKKTNDTVRRQDTQHRYTENRGETKDLVGVAYERGTA